MLAKAYLTDKQLEIWRLRLKRLSQAEIGRHLGITRQAVHYAEGYILPKVEETLTQIAEANMLDVKYIDSTRGVLLGYSPSSREQVIVTFSAVNGVQTWHYQQPDCGVCDWVDRCKGRLLQEAEERGVEISGEMKGLPPSELAHRLFSRIIPELSQ